MGEKPGERADSFYSPPMPNSQLIITDSLSQLYSLQCWSEIIETNAKNGVVFDATSNEQPI